MVFIFLCLEQGVEENIWTAEGRSDSRLESGPSLDSTPTMRIKKNYVYWIEIHRLLSRYLVDKRQYENTDRGSPEDTAVPFSFNAPDDGRLGRNM
jgi:hypothetical protein